MNVSKAILYTRVSTSDQAEHGTSLGEQLAACTKKAEQLGAQVVGHEEDAGISGGAYLTRNGLQNALGKIEAGHADTLIIANLSRFSRDREHQSAIKKRVQAGGGRLVFCDMDFADTPEGDLAFGIMGTFADYERKVIRERTVKGRRRRAEEGIQPGRSEAPYGYHIPTHADVLRGSWLPETLGTYQIIEARAAFAREMFARAATGDSLRSICRWLTSAGAPTSQGGKAWYQTSLLCILRNPAYKGVGVYGRTQQFTDERRRTEQGLRHVTYSRQRAPEEWQTFAVPALVDEATWNAVQERLDTNQARLSGNPRRKYLLSGVARCGLCGGPMTGFRSNGGASAYYRCRDAGGWRKDGVTSCAAGCCPMAELERLVLAGFVKIAASPDTVAGAVEAWRESRRRQAAPMQVERTRVEAELAALDRREKATISAQIAGIAAGARPESYTAEFTEIARLRTSLTEQQKAVPATPAASEPEPEKVADAVCYAVRSLAEVLAAGEITVEEKHRLLSRVIEKVVPDSKFTQGGLRAVDLYITPPFKDGPEGQTVQRIVTR